MSLISACSISLDSTFKLQENYVQYVQYVKTVITILVDYSIIPILGKVVC